MPVASLRRRVRPLGVLSLAQQGAMKARAGLRQRSGTCRHSTTSSGQAGASRSNAFLWSMNSAARPC
eukprot:11040698-Alexandrium_andersonii.AAC.1